MSVALGPFAKLADAKFGALNPVPVKIGTATVVVDFLFDGWFDEGAVFYDLGHYSSPRLQMQKYSADASAPDGNTVALPGGGGTMRQAGGDGSLPWLTLTDVPAVTYPDGSTKVAFGPFYFQHFYPTPGTRFDRFELPVFSRLDVYGAASGAANIYRGQDYLALAAHSVEISLSVTPLTLLFPILRDNLRLCGEVLQIIGDSNRVLWQSAPAVEIDIERTLAAANPGGVAPPLLVYGWIDSPTESQLIDTWTIF
ncbi:MAG: hypothetical protein KIS62_12480 [Ramlibacter sp.]|nr:hypothetical protein [Ramlibacter sp.]